MKYYLSDNIYIENQKTYIENDKNKKIKITKKNWHQYLSEYGWFKLELGWKKRLKENNNNSCFGLLECGSDGDCLFHVLCEALNSENLINLKLPEYNVQNLRELTATQINNDNFDIIIESYKIEKENNEFNGNWDPDTIKNINDLQNEIKISGNNFWGDHILLQLIQEKLKINIIIFNSENYFVETDKFKINSTVSNDFEKYDRTIMIYFSDQIHFQLIGYFDGNKMKTIFAKNEMPEIVLEVYNKDCRN